jgi:hypothetical protein
MENVIGNVERYLRETKVCYELRQFLYPDQTPLDETASYTVTVHEFVMKLEGKAADGSGDGNNGEKTEKKITNEHRAKHEKMVAVLKKEMQLNEKLRADLDWCYKIISVQCKLLSNISIKDNNIICVALKELNISPNDVINILDDG